MAKYDEFCELCDEKIKQTYVKIGGKVHEVCNHCKSLSVEDDDVYEFRKLILKTKNK